MGIVILSLQEQYGKYNVSISGTITYRQGYDSKGIPLEPVRVGTKDYPIQVGYGEHLVFCTNRLIRNNECTEIECSDLPDTRVRKHKSRTYITIRKGMSYPKLGRW